LKFGIYIVFASLFSSGLIGCTGKNSEKTSGHNQQSVSPSHFSYRVLQVNGGWGYDLLIDTVVYVHQDHIPAIQGIHAFRSESDAYATATFAIEKMQQGIMPPTISVEELKDLGVVLPDQSR